MNVKLPPPAVALAVLLPVLLAACSEDGDPPTGTDSAPESRVASVELSPSSAQLSALEASQEFNATARDQDGETMSDVDFSWSIAPDSVASVDDDGTVTAESNGTATVRVEASGESDSAELVVEQAVDRVLVEPDSARLATPADSQRFRATPADANGHPVGGTAVAWASDDTSVATVDSSGLARGRGEGAASILATARQHTDSATLVVDEAALSATIERPADDTVTLSGDSITLEGNAHDPEEGELGGDALVWESDVDGQLGTGDSLSVSLTDDTTHSIRLTASNSEGESASDTVVVSVPCVSDTGISIDETVCGTVSSPGDVDEFTFQGQAGDTVAVLLQGRTGDAGDRFELRVLDSSREQLGETADSDGADESLFDTGPFGGNSTGRIVLPLDGTYTVEVQGVDEADDTGPYRFHLEEVDPGPEEIPASIAVGDTVGGEELHPAGDVDEFTFQGEAGDTVAVLLQGRTGDSGDHFRLRVLDPGRDQLGETAGSSGDDGSLADTGPFGGNSTGRIVLPVDGSYDVVVLGQNDDEDDGAYRFHLDEVDPGPEDVSPDIAIGDTVEGAQLHPASDVDEFTFQGQAGDTVTALLQGRTGDSSDHFRLRVLDPGRDQLGETAASGGTDESLTETGSLGRNSTGRVELPADGSYTVIVLGQNDDEDDGAYRFHLDEVDPRPEDVSPDIAIGDTVEGAQLHPAGDVDEFTFQGEAGDSVAVLLQGRSGDGGDGFLLAVLSPSREQVGETARSTGADESLSETGSLGRNSTGRIELPADGSYTVVVLGQTDDADDGAYRFHLDEVDPRPETISPDIAIGDTVEGEELHPAGDVDEFTFQGQAGDSVAVLLQGRSGDGGDGFHLGLLDPNRTQLGDLARSTGADESLTDTDSGRNSTGRVELPADGSYTVVVLGQTDDEDDGAYRFFVEP